eukprot:14021731-Alexandrium_andersonii.AAC.2
MQTGAWEGWRGHSAVGRTQGRSQDSLPHCRTALQRTSRKQHSARTTSSATTVGRGASSRRAHGDVSPARPSTRLGRFRVGRRVLLQTVSGWAAPALFQGWARPRPGCWLYAQQAPRANSPGGISSRAVDGSALTDFHQGLSRTQTNTQAPPPGRPILGSDSKGGRQGFRAARTRAAAIPSTGAKGGRPELRAAKQPQPELKSERLRRSGEPCASEAGPAAIPWGRALSDVPGPSID